MTDRKDIFGCRNFPVLRNRNAILRRRHRKMKLGILDVKVFLQNGTRINLEMQLRRQKFWEKRSLYYLAKMYADILFM